MGLARELARIGLPLSTYTQWYWKTDLHNLLHFLALRADAHAQWEIREYARVILDVVERWVPLTANAFHSYRAGGARLSAEGLAVVKRLLAGEEVDPATLENVSPRMARAQGHARPRLIPWGQGGLRGSRLRGNDGRGAGLAERAR